MPRSTCCTTVWRVDHRSERTTGHKAPYVQAGDRRARLGAACGRTTAGVAIGGGPSAIVR